jgi:O-antigen ligase
MIWGILLYLILFTAITLYRFHYGIFLFFLLLPTYLIRFNIGLLPTTLLETMIWIILIIWIFKYNKKILPNLKSYILSHKNLFIASTLFMLAATISIFTAVDLKSAAGEWKAFYIEPFLIFIVLITTLKNSKNKILKYIVTPLILCGLATSILAIYQHFTGWMVPWDFWENRNTFRITGWYGYPNAVGLFLAPLVPLAIYGLIEKIKKIRAKNKDCLMPYILFLITAPFAIFFAKSTGGLIGVVAGLGILLLFYKKTRWPTVVIGILAIISIFSLPNLSNLREELTMQDRSGQIRIAMWGEASALLTERPIFGAGLRSYGERIVPYHTTVNGEGIEIFHLPHNLFLAIWVNTGLLGLFSFLWMIIIMVRMFLFSLYKKRSSGLSYFIISTIVVILTMGLVDTPYIKNDLSIFFWTIIALFLIQSHDPKLENAKN